MDDDDIWKKGVNYSIFYRNMEDDEGEEKEDFTFNNFNVHEEEENETFREEEEGEVLEEDEEEEEESGELYTSRGSLSYSYSRTNNYNNFNNYNNYNNYGYYHPVRSSVSPLQGESYEYQNRHLQRASNWYERDFSSAGYRPSNNSYDFTFKRNFVYEGEEESESAASSNNYNFGGFSFNHHQVDRISTSSISSFSTPEPIFGKLSKEMGGFVGLRNLGNSCYLNSTLQCLTAVGELSYRLAEEFEAGQGQALNYDKILLKASCRLFHEMWQSEGKLNSLRRSAVEPRQFKTVLGRIDSRFLGYRQEDSQEALSIILDVLHEDLKTEICESEKWEIDSDGWKGYCAKENSLVRELFHGQLKSTLKCCKCSFKSATFDPFCLLNLPIPVEEVNVNGNINDPIASIYMRDVTDININIGDATNINMGDTTNTNMGDTTNISSEISTTISSEISTNMSSAISTNISSEISTNCSSTVSKNISTTDSTIISTNFTTPFSICCYNESVLNVESSYLIIKKTFLNSNDFNSSRHLIIDFARGHEGIREVGSNLPSFEELNNPEKVFIVYKADFSPENTNTFLITFTDKNGKKIGFPILIKALLDEVSFTLESFVKKFLNEKIRNIYKFRFPSRLELFDENVQLISSNLNDHFKIKDVEYPRNQDGNSVQLIGKEIEILDTVNNQIIFSLAIGDDFNELFDQICNDESEDYRDIDTDINDDIKYSGIEDDDNTKLETKTPTLKDCFDRLCSIEYLSEEDNWTCERCKIPVRAEKQLQIWRLPEILICHLKRFSYGGSGGGTKINTAIDFELEIDLIDVIEEESPKQSVKFELFAISQHFGSLNYGHYTAIIKHYNSGKWFRADDGTVSVLEDDWFDDVKVKESAYVLFYRRKGGSSEGE